MKADTIVVMFSGIVQEVGTVKNINSKSNILELVISSSGLIRDLQIGSSIAVNGCCQTVVEKDDKSFKVEATQETLGKTNFRNLQIGSKVNLEASLKLGEKLDGHLVTGHIDGIGEVEILDFSEDKIIKIFFPKELDKFIAQKGSVAVNGVSLTVIEVKNDNFTFSLIPYTKNNTNLGFLKSGDLVNLEVDLISRYLINYLEKSREYANYES